MLFDETILCVSLPTGSDLRSRLFDSPFFDKESAISKVVIVQDDGSGDPIGSKKAKIAPKLTPCGDEALSFYEAKHDGPDDPLGAIAAWALVDDQHLALLA